MATSSDNTPNPDNPPIPLISATERELQAKLALYHKSIEEEFNIVNTAIESGEAPAVAEAARKLLMAQAAEAAVTIGWLAKNAVSEATRLQASKYIIDNCLGKNALAPPVDPLENLIKSLQGAKDEETSNIP